MFRSRIGNLFRNFKAPSRTTPKRNMSGHDHGHGHHAPGPYDPPHTFHYPEKAYPLGMGPNYKVEDWEFHTLLTYGMIIYLVLSMDSKPGVHEYHRKEAEARLQILENGGTVEFGKIYHKETFEHDDHEMPVQASSD